MKSYAEVQERIAGLRLIITTTTDEDKLAILNEEIEALTIIAGSDADDMMTIDGTIDFLWEEYPEDSDFEEIGNRLRKWFGF